MQLYHPSIHYDNNSAQFSSPIQSELQRLSSSTSVPIPRGTLRVVRVPSYSHWEMSSE